MTFQQGNQFWKARSSHGRRPLYDDPVVLWEDCCEYFQWVEDNPLWESKLVSFQGDSKIEILPKMRAMTLSGLQLFIDMHQTTWDEYRQKDDFSLVVNRVDKIIYDQKFSGAAADLLNANIIARDLGLKDKSAQELTGKDGGPFRAITREMTQAEADQIYQDSLKSL